MKDELITYKTAVMAKENGFDVPDYRGIITVFFKGKIDYISEMTFIENRNIFILCPTQSLLQRWLREVHNIHVKIDVYEGELYYPFVGNPRFLQFHKEFTTYESALEAGLQKALELITIK